MWKDVRVVVSVRFRAEDGRKCGTKVTTTQHFARIEFLQRKTETFRRAKQILYYILCILSVLPYLCTGVGGGSSTATITAATRHYVYIVLLPD